MSREADLKKLMTTHQRHLQILKEKQATFGLHVPAYILIEIEDIEAKIESLQAELASLEASRDSKKNQETPSRWAGSPAPSPSFGNSRPPKTAAAL